MLLAAHNKLGTVSRVGLFGCDEIDALSTDRRADSADLSALKSKGIDEIALA
jgi:DeoR/GlpR family transcriptional regulator of sugar metabolism